MKRNEMTFSCRCNFVKQRTRKMMMVRDNTVGLTLHKIITTRKCNRVSFAGKIRNYSLRDPMCAIHRIFPAHPPRPRAWTNVGGFEPLRETEFNFTWKHAIVRCVVASGRVIKCAYGQTKSEESEARRETQ